MKRLTLFLTDREVELLIEGVETLSLEDPENVKFRLKISDAILDAETLNNIH